MERREGVCFHIPSIGKRERVREVTSRPDPASNNSTPKTKVRVQEYASIRNTPITKVEVFKETSKTYAEALKTGIEGRPTTNKVKKIHKFDRSRPGQQYKIRSPRIPQRKGDGSKFRQRNGRDKFHTNHSHNGYNALRRIRKKHSWKNPAEHDGGMPRGGKEAACGGFRYIHRSDGKTSRNTREDVGLKGNSKQAESVEKISGLGKGKGETSKRKLGCSVRVAVQGLLSYAKSLSAVMGRIGIENGPLLSLAAALRANGAAIPLEQATPMTSFDLVDWARGQDLKTHLAMLVCWKTASRWGETAALSRDQFISVSPSEIIIDWFRTPKGRRANPYSPSRWTVIKGNHTEEIKILLDAMGEFKKLHPWDTSKLVKTFQQDGRMKRYTAHSIKRGAISHLLEVLASDQEQQGLTEGLISRLAKHAGVSALSDTTLRYGGNPIAMARALKIGDVTCLL